MKDTSTYFAHYIPVADINFKPILPNWKCVSTLWNAVRSLICFDQWDGRHWRQVRHSWFTMSTPKDRRLWTAFKCLFFPFLPSSLPSFLPSILTCWLNSSWLLQTCWSLLAKCALCWCNNTLFYSCFLIIHPCFQMGSTGPPTLHAWVGGHS